MTKARDLANIISTGVPNSLITLDAAEIPNISTDKLTSGTLANARVADFPASKTTSGTFIDARLPSTALNSNVDLTTLSASNLTSGTVATARLGTGTADGTTFLRGDQSYAAAGGGKIGQVVQTILTTTTSVSSATYADFGLSVAITPTATNSKILVIVNFCWTAYANYAHGQLTKDIGGAGYSSTGFVGTGTLGSRTASTFAQPYINSPNANKINESATTILDAPATTSVVTYKAQVKTDGGTHILYINTNHGDTDSGSTGRTVSTITAMEVLA